jgi:hypothetical protein
MRFLPSWLGRRSDRPAEPGDGGRLAVATVVAKNYLAYARVLARSLRRHHPELPLFVLLTDEVEGLIDPEREPFRLLTLRELEPPIPADARFRYSRKALAVAAKPHLLEHLLDRGFSAVLFLDADVLVLAELRGLLAAVRRHPLVVTPHLVAPVEGPERAELELVVLRSGVFNLGVMGVSDRPSSRRFLAWWRQRLDTHCRHDLRRGLHFDQRWADLIPSFVEGARLLRHPGINVGYWNLRERPITVRGESILAGGVPCRLFHFSGFSADRPEQVTSHRPSLQVSDLPSAAPLFDLYREELASAGYEESSRWPYAYGRFDNGRPVLRVARELYEELGSAAARFGDPFAASGPDSFFHWLGEPVDGALPGSQAVTRLWQAEYLRRPDLQRAFPDPTGEHREPFLRWIEESGWAQHGRETDDLMDAETPVGPPGGNSLRAREEAEWNARGPGGPLDRFGRQS